MSGLALTGLALSVAVAPSWAGQGVSDSAPSARVAAEGSEPPTVTPAFKFLDADYAVAGAGLRNQSGASVTISGAKPPTKAALLYWAVISNGAPPAAATSVTIQRRLPIVGGAASVAGVAVGSGAAPCWPGDTITVYRGRVPLGVVNGAAADPATGIPLPGVSHGNGTYQIALNAGAVGRTDGADPFSSAPLPLMEGVSLVLIGSGSGAVDVYDKGLAGRTFGGGANLTYTLWMSSLPGAVTRWDNIGADGQWGGSRLVSLSVASETTTVNGVAVAGPGSPYSDSDWNGNAAGPLPQLWDNTGHDISSAVSARTRLVRVEVKPGADCLTPVANIIGRFPTGP